MRKSGACVGPVFHFPFSFCFSQTMKSLGGTTENQKTLERYWQRWEIEFSGPPGGPPKGGRRPWGEGRGGKGRGERRARYDKMVGKSSGGLLFNFLNLFKFLKGIILSPERSGGSPARSFASLWAPLENS